MKELIKILEKFDENRSDECKESTWNEEAVVRCFRPCAEDIFCGGYFLVNDKFIIDLGCIELYYHEEGESGKIKDPIMYHTNDHKPYSKFYQEKGRYPYFEFGSFNLHQSGVDVTFEKPEEYRASFLIRSYRIFEIGRDGNRVEIEEKVKDPSSSKFNPRSTHIFDDMFPNGIMLGNCDKIKVEWVPFDKTDDKSGNVVTCKRVNVHEYKKENGVYVRDDKGEYIEESCSETREWGFKRMGIKESK